MAGCQNGKKLPCYNPEGSALFGTPHSRHYEGKKPDLLLSKVETQSPTPPPKLDLARPARRSIRNTVFARRIYLAFQAVSALLMHRWKRGVHEEATCRQMNGEKRLSKQERAELKRCKAQVSPA